MRTRDPFGSVQRISGSGLPLTLQVSCVLEDSFTVRFGVEKLIAGASEKKNIRYGRTEMWGHSWDQGKYSLRRGWAEFVNNQPASKSAANSIKV